jgi:radical SAM protein with 4Fe4S-binding SPASM domain
MKNKFELSKVKKINIDISTLCNHACSFCSNKDARTLKNRMSLLNFEEICKKIKDSDVKVSTVELGLSGKGEPFLNNEIVDIILCAKRYNFPYVYLTTNGSEKKEKKINLAIDSGLDSIKFSINALNSKEYKNEHGKDHFDLVLNNLRHVIEIKKRNKPELKILINIISKYEKHEVDNFYRSLLKGDYPFVDNINVAKLHYTPLFDGDVLLENYLEKNYVSYTSACSKPFDEIWIDPDGELVLCCNDYFREVSCGSIIDNSLSSIWNSSECMNEIRRMHLKNKFDKGHICSKCLSYSDQGI